MDPKLNPNEDGLIFSEWLVLVDRELVRMCEFPSSCLADAPLYDMWNDSVPAREAAECVLVEWNDFPGELIA